MGSSRITLIVLFIAIFVGGVALGWKEVKHRNSMGGISSNEHAALQSSVQRYPKILSSFEEYNEDGEITYNEWDAIMREIIIIQKLESNERQAREDLTQE